MNNTKVMKCLQCGNDVQCSEKLPKWVHISDSLPDPGIVVLVFTHDGEVYLDQIDEDCDDGDLWYDHSLHYEHYSNVAKPPGSVGPGFEAPYTHWMYIPKPPVE